MNAVTTTTAAQIAPRFHTSIGTIIGWRDKGVIRATGIPYAFAARFQPPVPIAPSTDPIMATQWAPACPQVPVSLLQKILGDSPLSHLDVDEHCQHLSITLPANVTHTAALPVMVWIHGGSYTSGSGDATIFDARSLVEEQQVIVVNISYRLGLFGFLGGYANRAANLGLLDMIEALRWIKQHIGAFGGDADHITLFGQSAGGDAIAHLMIATGGEQLFRRAIIQSAPLGISRGRHKMTAAMTALAAGIPETATVEEILSKHEHVARAARRFGLKAGMPFGTQYGHAPLPNELALEQAWLRCAPQYDVLIGFAEQETLFFLPFIESIKRMAAWPLIGKSLQRWLVRITTGKVYANASKAFARRHAKGGGKAWLYNITWKQGMGPMHTMDIPLLFGDERTWRPAQLVAGITWNDLHETGKQVRALWAQFASTGQLPKAGTVGNDVLRYSQL